MCVLSAAAAVHFIPLRALTPNPDLVMSLPLPKAATIPRCSLWHGGRRSQWRPRSNAMSAGTTEKLVKASTTASPGVSFPILVNGCTGKMGRAVAEAAVTAGLQLLPISFSSRENPGRIVQVGNTEVQIHTPSERESVLSSVFDEYPDVVVVDYTVPDAVNGNAELYCKVGVPFVMGTTGGDRQVLYKTVQDANVYAVISPQMGKQVVAFLAAMEIMADQFPGAFSGYTLQVHTHRVFSHQKHRPKGEGDYRRPSKFAKTLVGIQRTAAYGHTREIGDPILGRPIRQYFPVNEQGVTVKLCDLAVMESHQATKLDTSGTAKSVISCFNKLGLPFDLEQIQQIRDPEKQLEMVGVPEEHLSGHAFHLYHIMSPDETVSFEFQHNVCGRSIYAEGSIDAAVFLHSKVQSKAEKKIYNMIDVLREGNMR